MGKRALVCALANYVAEREQFKDGVLWVSVVVSECVQRLVYSGGLLRYRGCRSIGATTGRLSGSFGARCCFSVTEVDICMLHSDRAASMSHHPISCY